MTAIFEEQREAWASPPIDDIGYIESKYLLSMGDGEFSNLMLRAISNRYSVSGWRNYKSLWRKSLKLDQTSGMRVLDYGCGAGFEALQYAGKGNRVWLADIAPLNLQVAERTLATKGFSANGIYQISGKPPFIEPTEKFHVIHCSGVLHHIPKPEPVVREMATWLEDKGELRLMLYTEKAWERCTGTKAPGRGTHNHKEFETFVRCMDGVGEYAEWYDEARLNSRFGKWFDVTDVTYLTPWGIYLTAILVKK